jgi:hypothetical protein
MTQRWYTTPTPCLPVAPRPCLIIRRATLLSHADWFIYLQPMDYSWYAPFLKAGIEVWPVFDGTSECCQADFGNGKGSSCNMLVGKEALAQELLDVALKYNLTGWQQDWEFNDAWNWLGCER